MALRIKHQHCTCALLSRSKLSGIFIRWNPRSTIVRHRSSKAETDKSYPGTSTVIDPSTTLQQKLKTFCTTADETDRNELIQTPNKEGSSRPLMRNTQEASAKPKSPVKRIDLAVQRVQQDVVEVTRRKQRQRNGEPNTSHVAKRTRSKPTPKHAPLFTPQLKETTAKCELNDLVEFIYEDPQLVDPPRPRATFTESYGANGFFLRAMATCHAKFASRQWRSVPNVLKLSYLQQGLFVYGSQAATAHVPDAIAFCLQNLKTHKANQCTTYKHTAMLLEACTSLEDWARLNEVRKIAQTDVGGPGLAYYHWTIIACIRQGGKALWPAIRKYIDCSPKRAPSIDTILVEEYCKVRNWIQMEQAWAVLSKRNIKKQSSTFNAMLEMCIETGNWPKMGTLWGRLKRKKPISQEASQLMLEGYWRTEDWHEMDKVHNAMIKELGGKKVPVTTSYLMAISAKKRNKISLANCYQLEVADAKLHPLFSLALRFHYHEEGNGPV